MSSGAFDKTFRVKTAPVFEDRAESTCPACYAVVREEGYCQKCLDLGHATRHQENRNRGW